MVQRSLLIAPQWLGDAVMTEPLVRRLAARGERLTVAVLPHLAPIYQAMPGVAEILELALPRQGLQWAQRRQLGRSWRGRFDRAYVAPNSLKSALLPWLAAVPERLGYVGEFRYGLLNRTWPNPSRKKRPPMVAHYSALADEQPGCEAGGGHSSAASGVDGQAMALSDEPPLQPPAQGQDQTQLQLQPRLHVPEAEIASVVQSQGLSEGSYLVLVPGAEYGPAKRWPSAHFSQLAARWPGPVVLLGSAKEAALCQEIERQALEHAAQRAPFLHNLAGRTDLAQALAWIAGAAQVVSNDSGLMHVAAALQVPQVALFGSSSPEHTPPLSDVAQVIWLKQDPDYRPALDCAPCFKRECPMGHTRCLNDIQPEQVLQRLLRQVA